MNDRMISWGFNHLSCESCVYYRKSDSGIIICAVHVDDFLSISSTKEENENFKNQMCQVWTISDLGNVRFVIGITVHWDRPNHMVMLSQTALIDKIIVQFGQRNTLPSSVPMDPGLKLRRADYKKMQYFTLPGLFHMESMEWRVEADGFHGMADGFHGLADGFHTIPWNFQMDSILFSQWSPYGIHME